MQKKINDIKYALTNKFKISAFGLVSWYLGFKITCNKEFQIIFMQNA